VTLNKQTIVFFKTFCGSLSNCEVIYMLHTLVPLAGIWFLISAISALNHLRIR
jgi:hypothetical protein